MRRPESVQPSEQRRNGVLAALVEGVPDARFLGIRFDRRGDDLTANLTFDDSLIGNPVLPARHGGVTAAFLAFTAIIELSWSLLWEDMEAGRRYASLHVGAWQNNRARLFARATGHFLMPGRDG